MGLTTCECYLHHTISYNNGDRLIKYERLARIGEAKQLVRTIGVDDCFCEEGPRNINEIAVRDNMITVARQILGDLIALRLELSELNISRDIFLEYLINCIRNEVVSYQTCVFKNLKALQQNFRMILHC